MAENGGLVPTQDGYEHLEAEHRAVEHLFVAYFDEPDDAIARDICEHLTAHTNLEELALYPTVRKYVDGGDDLVDQADQEHALVKSLIARIYDSPPEDIAGMLRELETAVHAHVTKEESEIFPALQDSGVDGMDLAVRLERKPQNSVNR
jgi:hemerythrin superfamily protein